VSRQDDADRVVASSKTDRLVVLGRDNDATAIVVHYLAQRFDDIVTVVEEAEAPGTLLRRRARRLGWRRVAGQVVFTTVVLPVLHRRGRARIRSILADAGLDPTPVTDVRRVPSVNAPETIAMLRELAPAAVVVIGTRIIARTVLQSVPAPFVNVHPGITPHYRGMHGAYWALSEGRPELVGTTVHLVDAGVDTGEALARTYFTPGPDDSIATYFYLHVASALPALTDQLTVLTDARPETIPSSRATPPPGGHDPLHPPTTDALPGDGASASADESKLWFHPTVWEYLRLRWQLGLR